jgi:hypothetical protein
VECTDNEPAAGLNAVLEAAETLTDTYRDYDVEAALERVTALAQASVEQAPVLCVPTRHLTIHEQAAHDLDLAVSLIVDAPQACASLTRLLDTDPTEPEGALVFAALLHLAGYREPSQFWLEFAAGAGHRTAAFCLSLLHQQCSEHRTAAHWRTQIDPPSQPFAPPPTGTLRHPHLLPDAVRRELIRRCWEGLRPLLPPRFEAVIHSLPVEHHSDFGEIPRPDYTLTQLPALVH